MTKSQKRAHAAAVVSVLREIYPAAECALQYAGDPWRLLVMGRLSAQCTDARVNIVCKDLFTKYPSAEAMASADIEELEAIVRPCGLYRVKAADIKAASARLMSEYGGVLPSDMDALLSFPGVGRKIANLLRGDLFGLPAVVTDTHCIRICGRLGFYPEKEKRPLVVERILTDLLPPAETSDFCHRIVLFGREYCMARAPRCAECPLAGLCKRREKHGKATH
ncbi:MAG: endonuclease III [Clostridia bacterium]|nr:endonuclease III [Clostridia bacterium]